jgi:hypothetical protein
MRLDKKLFKKTKERTGRNTPRKRQITSAEIKRENG